MRRTHDSEPATAGGLKELSEMEQRMFDMIMDRFDRVERRQDMSDESRRMLHEKLNHTERMMDGLKSEVKSLDKSLSALTPTVQDYIVKTHQVQGAGMLGRALWWLGGLILAAASSVVAYLYGKG